MKNFENRNKIARVSKLLRTLLFAGLVFWSVGAVVFLVTIILQLNTAQQGQGRILDLAGALLMMPLGFAVNFCFLRFFDRLQKGHLFDAQTVGHLAAAGKWWLMLWLFGVVFSAIRLQAIPYSSLSNGGLFGALCVIFTAWLFREAQELQEERALTI